MIRLFKESWLGKLKNLISREKNRDTPSQDDPVTTCDLPYAELASCLKCGNWWKADRETYRLIFQQNYCSPKDLCTFDKLWWLYSKGRFGFSVQEKIYKNLGGSSEYNYAVWSNFCYKVGWANEEKYHRPSCFHDEVFYPKGYFPKYVILQGKTVIKVEVEIRKYHREYIERDEEYEEELDRWIDFVHDSSDANDWINVGAVLAAEKAREEGYSYEEEVEVRHTRDMLTEDRRLFSLIEKLSIGIKAEILDDSKKNRQSLTKETKDINFGSHAQ